MKSTVVFFAAILASVPASAVLAQTPSPVASQAPGAAGGAAAPAVSPAADAPELLSSDPSNRSWRHIASKGEILYTGSGEAKALVRVAFVREAVDRVQLTIDTDATSFLLMSGFGAMEGKWAPGQPKTIQMSMDANAPSLLVGGVEVPALKGPWAGVAAETKDKQVILELPKATYANITYPSAAAEAAATASASTTAPAAPVTAQGPWTVTILTKPGNNAATLQQQIKDLEGQIRSARSALPSARDNYQYSVRRSERSHYDGRGNYVGTTSGNTQEVADALTVVTRLESQERTAQLNINKLRRQLQMAQTTRVLTAKRSDGAAVTILASGPDAVALADSLVMGKTYSVTGVQEKLGPMTRIKLAAATPAP
jgi:hypothetical protein